MTIVLARLLAPEDFGLVSFAMIIIGMTTLLQDLGVPAALIFSEREAPTLAGTALTINLCTAVVFIVLTASVAPALSALTDESDIMPIVVTLSIGLVFSAAGSVQAAMLSKAMAFRRKAVPEIVALVAEAVVAVSMALAGFGVWSLVGGYLTLTSTSSILLWIISPLRTRPGFDYRIARELLSYGKHVSFNAVVGFMLMNVDYLIIGTRLGAMQLGVYALAFTVASLPSTAISQVVSTAMFPAYSKLRGSRVELVNLFDDVFSIVTALSIAAGLVIFGCGAAYMTILLGDQWQDIEQPMRILAAYGVFRSIGWVFPPVYKALGRPDVEWRLSMVKLFLIVPALLVGVMFGLLGIAYVQVFVVVVFLPINAFVLSRIMSMHHVHIWRLIAPHSGAFGVSLTALLLSDYIITSITMPSIIASTFSTIIAIFIYVYTLLLLDRRLGALAARAAVFGFAFVFLNRRSSSSTQPS